MFEVRSLQTELQLFIFNCNSIVRKWTPPAPESFKLTNSKVLEKLSTKLKYLCKFAGNKSNCYFQ